MFDSLIESVHHSLMALLTVSRIELVAFLGTLLSALGVVISPHMMANLLCLISAFLFGSVMCLIHHAEFLAFLIPIVYIGAIVILFLFIIMMVDFRLKNTKPRYMKNLFDNFLKIAPLCIIVFAFLWSFVGGAWPENFFIENKKALPTNNVQAIGNILYTKYLIPFEIIAVILLMAMVAALWVLSRGQNNQKEKPIKTVPKDFAPTKSVTYVDVPFGKGCQLPPSS